MSSPTAHDKALQRKLKAKQDKEPATKHFIDDEFGVTVAGPYFRLDQRSGGIRKFYAVYWCEPTAGKALGKRPTTQRRIKGDAIRKAKEIVAELRTGAGRAASERESTVAVLLDAWQRPENHPKGMRNGRLEGWDSAQTVKNANWTANWIEPLIGDLRSAM